jgi:hypothetical protein
MTVIPVSDDRGAVAHADEPCAPVSVHYGLLRLEGSGPAEPQLQKFRAGNRVQSKGVHAH